MVSTKEKFKEAKEQAAVETQDAVKTNKGTVETLLQLQVE